MSLKQINGQEFDKEVLANERVTLVDFYADWCGPCRMMHPVLNEISEEMGEVAGFYKVNVDDNQELAIKYQVMTIPTILVLKNGEVKQEFIGVTSKDELVGALNQYK